MAYIDAIIRRRLLQPDRAAVQERVCLAVEADPERFLTAYPLDSRSVHERYVNSDLMKEMFHDYKCFERTPQPLQFACPQRSCGIGGRAVPASDCR
jgi:hypothetical protein